MCGLREIISLTQTKERRITSSSASSSLWSSSSESWFPFLLLFPLLTNHLIFLLSDVFHNLWIINHWLRFCYSRLSEYENLLSLPFSVFSSCNTTTPTSFSVCNRLYYRYIRNESIFRSTKIRRSWIIWWLYQQPLFYCINSHLIIYQVSVGEFFW